MFLSVLFLFFYLHFNPLINFDIPKNKELITRRFFQKSHNCKQKEFLIAPHNNLSF